MTKTDESTHDDKDTDHERVIALEELANSFESISSTVGQADSQPQPEADNQQRCDERPKHPDTSILRSPQRRQPTMRPRPPSESATRTEPNPEPEPEQSTSEPTTEPQESGVGRRSILGVLGMAGASGALGSVASGHDTDDSHADETEAQSPVEATSPRVLNEGRFEDVYDLRKEKAEHLRQPMPEHEVVNDGAQHDEFYARFTKGLPHDGVTAAVSNEDYIGYLEAVNSDDPDAWEDVNTGGSREFISPLASTTMPMLGADTHETKIAPPPELDSEQQAAELTELYWQSLLRDVPFSEYGSSKLAQAAADDLSRFDEAALPMPRENGRITTNTLFRGTAPGTETGPYLSQFMLQDAPYGAHYITQQIRTAKPNVDFITDRGTWFSNMNGTSLPESPENAPETAPQEFDDVHRYMRNGRDLTACVQRDVIPGQFLLATLVLTERPVDGIPPNPQELYDTNNPYRDPGSAHGFVTYARSGFLDLLTRASRLGLMSAWFQKWQVHRRARPEKLGGLVDMVRKDEIDGLFDPVLFDSPVFDRIEQKQGNALLSQAYAEGAPTHPAYPGGHATSSAAAGTVLKAVLNEGHTFSSPVVPSSDGQELHAFDGPALTVESEVNKLVENINIAGRQFAGVHYRSDTEAAYGLGEEVAIRLLEDVKDQTAEAAGFSFTSFSGSQVTI